MLLPFILEFLNKEDANIKQRRFGYSMLGALFLILWNEMWVLTIKTALVIKHLGFLHLKRFVNREVPLFTVAPELFQSKWLYFNLLVEHSLTWVVMTLFMAIGIKMILKINCAINKFVKDK